jgi:multicomponent Na+:H+ antiporter subunit D
MTTLLLSAPLALPLGGALLALVLPRRGPGIALAVALASLAATLALAARVLDQGPLGQVLGGWAPGLGIALRADGLATALLLLGALVMAASTLYAGDYFAAGSRSAGPPETRFWPLWLLLFTAINALLLAADLFNLYVTLELLGLSAAALAAFGGGAAALTAALRYLLLGLIGSLAFLAGVALVYAQAGTLDLTAPGPLLPAGPGARVALVLLTAGLLLKAALFPLHFWLPTAHANAPAPVSAALSALVVKVAAYLVLRLWLEPFAEIPGFAGQVLLGSLGAAAVLWGSWNALLAPRLKLLAAYSTVAQIGYLFLFLPLLAALPAGPARDTAFGALVLLALGHGLAKAALFLAAGVVQRRAGHDRINELAGTARALPVTTFTIALAGVALVGLPPSGAFLAKWHLLATAITTGQWWWGLAAGLGTLLAAAYLFRLLGHAFAEGEAQPRALAWGREELPALALALGATLVLGLAGAPVWTLVAPGALLPEVLP